MRERQCCRSNFNFIHAIDQVRREIEDRRRSSDPDRDIARILEINFSTNQDTRVFGRGIEKFQRSAIALEDDTTARLSEIEPSPAAGGQLSVYKLHIANDAGMLQRFGKSNASAQNAVLERLRIKKLARLCQKDRREIDCQAQGTQLESAPVCSDGQRKIRCETNWARIGHTDRAMAGVPASLRRHREIAAARPARIGRAGAAMQLLQRDLEVAQQQSEESLPNRCPPETCGSKSLNGFHPWSQ